MYDERRCMVRAAIRPTVLALSAAISLAPVSSRAEDGTKERAEHEAANDVVFEVRRDACTRLPNDYVRAVLSQLMRSGRAVDISALREMASGPIPQPSQTDPSMTAARIRAKFKEAERKATGKNWNFEQAITLYEEGLRWAEENQLVVVKELDAPNWMTEAFVGYSTALTRANKNPKDVYKRQIISFPDLPVTSSRHGPDAAALYEAARKELDASAHGTLLVTVNRPDANIFINYVGRGRGGNFQANVVAGKYEVLVEVGDKSLRYVVPTDPATNKHAELRIDWDLDSRMVVGESFVCIEHVANDRGLVRGLGRKFPGHGVVLASRQTSDGIEWIRAEKYEPGDTAPARRCVAPEGDNVGRKLTDCIDGQNVPGVLFAMPTKLTTQEQAAPPSRLKPWLGLGITVGAIGAGIYFSSVNGTCISDDPTMPGCDNERDARLETGISLAVGAGAFVYMLYAYKRYGAAVRSYRPTVGASATPGGGLVTLSGGF